ncbi:hypothetical protein SEA_CURSIVE_242 [Streptomyces phage Cursive]|uniref:Uncharacterized protein n=1 Tax=Streptomyces phage Cross TaxID=2805844 RepID=A0A890URC9_9CAUD|nr:hypothetical protein SEA_CROSS_238 [Streptomyces phage Cross]
MELKRLAKEFKEVFDEKQYHWRIDDTLTVPSERDILDTLEQVVERIAKEPSGTWVELGRLIFIKTGSLIDVYLHHGTIERQDEQPPTEPVL